VLGFTLGMRGGWDALVLCAFVCCGGSRLARYNVTAASLSDASGKVKYYEGTPIPTSLILVAVLAVAWWRGDVGERVEVGAEGRVAPAARDDAVGKVEHERQREQEERPDQVRIVTARLQVVETEEDGTRAARRVSQRQKIGGHERPQQRATAPARGGGGFRQRRAV